MCYVMIQTNLLMFRYKVNGMDGWGVSEWEYRHKAGKKV